MKKVRRKLNRIGALALAVVLMGTSIDFPVIAAGNCEHHTEHTEECGYKAAVEGTPCIFACDECSSEESGQEDEEQKNEGETDTCICEDKCTADAVNEECPVCFAENADLNNCIGEVEEMQSIITAWSFIDEYECIDLETNTLALPGANAENVALKEDIISLLPASIKASINDAEETLALSGWECANYPQEGAYAGTYTFSATLPEGYTLGEEVSELTVNVELGGAGLYDEEQTIGDFTVTGGTHGQDYTYDNAARLLTIKSSKEITIANTNQNIPTEDRIFVEVNVNANITLAGVNIDVSGTEYAAAFKIADNSAGNVTITLADGTTNTLKSGMHCAGLQKNGAYISETQGKLTITGTGSLTATGGGYGAGIGGGEIFDGSNIEISGGTVTATGDRGGAGIGGGNVGSGSNITISGGTVTATGGACIGGSGGGSDIKISGGTVKADTISGTPTDGTDNVYLLELTSATSSLKIDGKDYPINHGTDGKVYVYLPEGEHTIVKDGGAGTTAYYAKNADNKLEAVAIGTAFTITGTDLVYGTDYTYPASTGVLTILSDKDITIKNATPSTPTTNRIEVADGVPANITLAGVNIDVSSQSDTAAFKIADDSAGNVTITLADGTTNTLKSGKNCAGLQKNGAGEGIGMLTICGTGSLSAQGGISGAGIGGGRGGSGFSGSGSNIEISGGTVTATGGTGGAGIGGGRGGSGYNGRADNIKISGGTVTATGGEDGAGIGGGSGGRGSNIEISGGTVTAEGGAGGAGIGGGSSGSGYNIKISGGTVTATGGEDGAGIGGGFSGSGSNIEISGGKVTATGGEDGAGIGGCSGGSGSDITISGGTVTATGGAGGAGIGGGNYNGIGIYIEISGGTVTATGGTGGAGIGGGYKGSADNITISGGSVKAVAGTVYQNCVPAAIGQGVQYDSNTGVYSNGVEVTPTDGTDNVYLLELTSATSSLKIDGKDYPINHGTDGKVYVYLPEGEHTIVKDGGAGTTAYYAKNADNKLEAVAIGTAFTITGTDLVYGTDYTYPASTGVLTILSDKDITIKNATPSTSTTDRIEVADGVPANITLAGVNIDVSSQSDTAAFKIADDSAGNVTITLADGKTNTLKSGTNCAGLQKNGGTSTGMLTIQGETAGTGVLTATGGESGAGIGGGFEGNGSNIEISGGKVTATGGDYGAGIGGGDGCDGSYITISGGEVTATCGESGAGIGGGFEGSGSYITISGGEVTATGGEYGAGIGGGFEGNGSNIEISGGKVTATGGDDGAGIGSGDSGSGSYITISGGEVTATGGEEAAGIGGGWNGNGSNIEISGGEVTATGGEKAAGIGGGFKGNGSNIEISGGSVKAVAGEGIEDEGTTYFPAAIGHGVQYDGNTGVYSNGAEVTPTYGADNVYLTDNVYLLELDVDGTSAVTINGKAYPTKHFDENKLYVYLPAKTIQAPNEVTVGNETTKYCYINAKWLKVVDSPEADDTEFTYDGTEKTYTFAGSDYCTITGNKQTNAGTYTVTVALNDKVNTVWSDDGTTDDKTYEFVINKATPTAKMFTYTAPTELDYDGHQKSATVTTDKVGMGDITIQYYKNGILTEPVECGIYSVKVSVAEGDNYTDATDLTADDWTFTINHVDADNNGYCDDCGAICDGIGAHLAGYTLSLNGSIGVNFHMDLTQDVLDDNEAYMLFTLPNGTTQKVMVSDAKAKEPTVIEEKKYYIFTCNVAAKEMTDTIQAQLITSDGSKTQVYEYSVREYADRILSSGSYDAETQELVKAMLHYGAYSQEWFDYNTTNLANAGLDPLDLSDANDWDGFDPIITNDVEVGSFTSAYLTLESDTAINLKFKLADGVSFEDLRVVVEDPFGNVVPVTTDTTENVCLITLTGIKASDLDTTYSFCVTDEEGNESAILYSAMSYACAVADSEMDQKLKNVTAALRIFNLKANEKFE